MMLAAASAMLVGLLMLGTGISLIVGNRVTAIEENAVTAVCQWTAEFTTAILLVAGGFGLLTESTWARPVFLIALVTLLLSVVGTLAIFSQGRRQRHAWDAAGAGVLAVVLVPLLIGIGFTW